MNHDKFNVSAHASFCTEYMCNVWLCYVCVRVCVCERGYMSECVFVRMLLEKQHQIVSIRQRSIRDSSLISVNVLSTSVRVLGFIS